MNRDSEDRVIEAFRNGDMEVDALGRVWRIRRRGWNRREGRAGSWPCPKRRAEHSPGNGYLQLRAMIDGKRTVACAHRVVYRLLKGDIPPGLTINHKDGCKSNNHPDNLELATYSEQIHHAREVIGKMSQSGEKNNNSKLSEDAVREIRRRRRAGEKMKMIAEDFNISDRTVSKIVRMDRWGFVC